MLSYLILKTNRTQLPGKDWRRDAALRGGRRWAVATALVSRAEERMSQPVLLVSTPPLLQISGCEGGSKPTQERAALGDESWHSTPACFSKTVISLRREHGLKGNWVRRWMLQSFFMLVNKQSACIRPPVSLLPTFGSVQIDGKTPRSHACYLLR